MQATRRSLVLAVAGAAAFTALAAAPPALAAGTVSPAVLSSSNSAGYAADTATYTSVASSWTEPAITCTSATTYSSVWVGLDGVNDSALEQTGTEADCVGGKAVYGAWWEVLPAAESAYSGVTVKPGDHMTASVTFNGGTGFTMRLADSTQGWTKTTTHAGSSGFQNSSAEIIVELTDTNGLGVSGSGSVAFTGSTVNGGTLAAAAPEQVIAPGTSVSSVSGGGAFTVTWGPGVGGGGPIVGVRPRS